MSGKREGGEIRRKDGTKKGKEQLDEKEELKGRGGKKEDYSNTQRLSSSCGLQATVATDSRERFSPEHE